MAAEPGPRARSWRRGAVAADWTDDERSVAALLYSLITDLVATEVVEVERNAGARRSPSVVEHEQERIAHEQHDEARQELAAFTAALRDARLRSGGAGRSEVAYDAARPEQNEQADLLIQYLVRPGYAEVRTEELRPGQHVYYFTIDWPRLEALSAENGHRLPF